VAFAASYHRDLLLGRTRADQVADHDESRRDPDPHLQGYAGCSLELRYRLNEGKRGANGALRIMLVRLLRAHRERGRTDYGLLSRYWIQTTSYWGRHEFTVANCTRIHGQNAE
jgi:hypothetical protein